MLAAIGAFSVLVLSSACDVKKLPTTPSDLVEGIVVYVDRDFRGTSALITQDIANLHDYQGPCASDGYSNPAQGVTAPPPSWGDCISSVKVAAGWQATLYGDDHYKGTRLEITESIPDLRKVTGDCEEGMNDCVSSIRVSRR